MHTSKLFRTIMLLLIVAGNVGCDQLSKNVVRKNISQTETMHLLNNHLVLMNVENTGAFLSLGTSLPSPLRWLTLSLFPVLALTVALFYLLIYRHNSLLFSVGLCFVIGGGIGNVTDRLLYGSVTDFLFIRAGIFRTGIFNLADMSIMTGACLIIIPMFIQEARKFSRGRV